MVFADEVVEALASLDVDDVAFVGLLDAVCQDLFESILGTDLPHQLRLQFLADCFVDDSDDEEAYILQAVEGIKASSLRKRAARKKKREGPPLKRIRKPIEPKED